MSKTLFPSLILKKPAHCVKAAGPNFATLERDFLFLNLPFSSLYLTIFSATVFDTPETYCKRDIVAVFTFTPTLFTVSSTTPVNASSSFF
ncbi:hypothetical protein D3C76_1349520 [compost metagenome]